MSKIELNPITSGYNVNRINTNFQKIEDEINTKMLSRQPLGEPNTMLDLLDMNGKRIINLPEPVALHEPLRLKDADDVLGPLVVRAEDAAVAAEFYAQLAEYWSNQSGGGGSAFSESVYLSQMPSYDINNINGAIAEANIILSSGGKIIFPKGDVTLTSSVTIPVDVYWEGQGKFTTRVLRTSGAVSVTMSNASKISDMRLFDSVNSGEFVTIPAATAFQEIINAGVRVNGSRCIDIAANGGEEMQVHRCNLGTSSEAHAAIGLTGVDSAARPRHFSNNSGSGSPIYDFTGMNDTFVNGGYTQGFICGSTASKVMMSNVRVGANAALGAQVIAGENHTLTNMVFATPVTLTCTDSRIDSIAPDWDFIDNGTGNSVEVKFRSYSPTITTTGSPFSIGDGAITAYFSRAGNLINVVFEVIIGSTTNLGSGVWYLSVPIQGANLGIAYTTNGSFQRTGASQAMIGAVVMEDDRNRVSFVYPDTVGSSQVITLNGSSVTGGVIDLSPIRFAPDTNSVKVYINGARLMFDRGDFVENSPTQITIAAPYVATDNIMVEVERVDQYNVGNNTSRAESWPVSSRLRGSFSYYCK